MDMDYSERLKAYIAWKKAKGLPPVTVKEFYVIWALCEANLKGDKA